MTDTTTTADNRTISETLRDCALGRRMAVALDYGTVQVNEMADYLGASTASLRNWTSGRRRPRRSTLVAWALKCGVDLEWLEHGFGTLGPIASAERAMVIAEMVGIESAPDPHLVVETLAAVNLLLRTSAGDLDIAPAALIIPMPRDDDNSVVTVPFARGGRELARSA